MPGGGIGSAQRISTSPVAVIPPVVTTASSGATWIAWGSGPAGNGDLAAKVLKARKLTFASASLSRTLDVLRARTDVDGELIGPSFRVVPTKNDAMLAIVDRQRTHADFWQLRTYGEG
jgi:hypothetical protein